MTEWFIARASKDKVPHSSPAVRYRRMILAGVLLLAVLGIVLVTLAHGHLTMYGAMGQAWGS